MSDTTLAPGTRQPPVAVEDTQGPGSRHPFATPARATPQADVAQGAGEVRSVSSDAGARVSALATSVRGRYVVSAGTRHFVSDARAGVGGPGEAVNAGELLLGALASCSLGLIELAAAEAGVALAGAHTEVDYERDPQDKTRYRYIRVRAFLPGVPVATAQSLLDRFTTDCPIYNTLRRGGAVFAEIGA